MVLEGQSKTDLQSLSIETTTFRVDGRNWTVYSELVLTMFLWGLAWPVGRLLATDLPPVSIAALRYAIVVPVLFGILKIKGQPIRLERKWIANLVIMGLFSTTLYQIFFLYGVRYAAASDDSLVIGIGPVLIAIMASFVLNERLTKTKGLGFISGLAGIGVISVGGALDLQLESSFVAWNSLPRPPLNGSRILLLCRRGLKDWSWESCDLRQLGPSFRRDNFGAPSPREPQPMAWSQLPTDSGRRGTCQQTEEDGADGTAIVANWIR